MKTVEITDQIRPFHPSVLAELPLDVILELKQVGMDLASGVIPNYRYDQDQYNGHYTLPGGECGTAHCIAGWVALRMKRDYYELFYKEGGPGRERFDSRGRDYVPPLRRLFAVHRSDPQMAAKAVEEYLYNYAADPWKAAGYNYGY